ncbi:hypothetical protein [Mucilaginibacter segetis]|uniref:Potassium transporter KefB n=1 Tax=Mucilaginibacter segetis TaxID=2793071 RepID=A0A934PQT9_9SPHI|nr:hypothetical protein [Mucilaginibacter segetis]MBK0378434.1 hypothetical protein [Mucilaginibacter segetis]
MTQANFLSLKPVFTPVLGKRIMAGALIGLALTGFFVIGAGKGNPAWGNYWQIKPLLLTPSIGAFVGICYDITESLRKLNGWLGKVFWVLSILGYVIGMWFGLILGLAGTMWT